MSRLSGYLCECGKKTRVTDSYEIKGGLFWYCVSNTCMNGVHRGYHTPHSDELPECVVEKNNG